MQWRSATEYLIVINVIILALYDAAARLWGGNEATLSFVLQDAAYRWPMIALAVGLLCGHVFWPTR